MGQPHALIRQPQNHPHNEEPEIRNRILWDRGPIFRCRRKPECPEKTYQGGYGHRQTKFTYNHWLAALVKGKCTSTKPTRLATGVVCHPDTERNRPYKIPWSCRGLNRGPTAPQARTLPVCHTDSIFHWVFCLYNRQMVIPTCSVSFSIIVCRYFSKWRIFCFLKTEKVASTPPPSPSDFDGLP